MSSNDELGETPTSTTSFKTAPSSSASREKSDAGEQTPITTSPSFRKAGAWLKSFRSDAETPTESKKSTFTFGSDAEAPVVPSFKNSASSVPRFASEGNVNIGDGPRSSPTKEDVKITKSSHQGEGLTISKASTLKLSSNAEVDAQLERSLPSGPVSLAKFASKGENVIARPSQTGDHLPAPPAVSKKSVITSEAKSLTAALPAVTESQSASGNSTFTMDDIQLSSSDRDEPR